MIQRDAEATLHRLEKGFPVLCITGPRQSGKTTLARMAFPDRPYISLEDPDIARFAKEDPRGLLDAYKDGLILDAAQYVPEIFAYLKTAVDKDSAPGRFIVTGSRQFGLLAGVPEALCAPESPYFPSTRKNGTPRMSRRFACRMSAPTSSARAELCRTSRAFSAGRPTSEARPASASVSAKLPPSVK
jgi:hypothetical protein